MRMIQLGVSISLICTAVTGWAQSEVASVDAQNCLDWKVEEHSAASNNSSCAYFNTEKVSTRFLVTNSCSHEVSGVFTYFKTNDEQRAVMNVRHFAVKPGREVEVANPCNISQQPAFQVSQVSFSG